MEILQLQRQINTNLLQFFALFDRNLLDTGMILINTFLNMFEALVNYIKGALWYLDLRLLKKGPQNLILNRQQFLNMIEKEIDDL